MVSKFRKPANRITATLFAGQSIVSAATIASATVLSIVATQITGDPSQAGLPMAITNLSAAPGAFLLGLLWDRVGRRKGLAFGLVFGILGMGVSLLAVQSGSFLLLLGGMVGQPTRPARTCDFLCRIWGNDRGCGWPVVGFSQQSMGFGSRDGRIVRPIFGFHILICFGDYRFIGRLEP
jgi:MFS family permease